MGSSPGNRFLVAWPEPPGKTAVVVPLGALQKSQTRLSAETVTGAGRGRGLQLSSGAFCRCRRAAVPAHWSRAPRSVQNSLPSASPFDFPGNRGPPSPRSVTRAPPRPQPLAPSTAARARHGGESCSHAGSWRLRGLGDRGGDRKVDGGCDADGEGCRRWTPWVGSFISPLRDPSI